jgi:FKBP-type peptidyl-prolyl cis-trans isomerase 2
MKTDSNSLVAIELQLQWDSDHGTHADCLFAEKVNLSWDIFPKAFLDQLMNRTVGDRVEMSFAPGEIIPHHNPSKQFSIKHSQFERHFHPGVETNPRQGRFYPKGILKDVANVFRVNKELFRCAEIDDSWIVVDFNHPLAGKPLHVNAVIRDIKTKTKATGGGGTCNDWLETLTTGPGMQIRWNGHPTDFFADDPFARSDEKPDGQFYEKPRFVNHIDDQAIETICSLYEQTLHTGDRVLDLMTSWTSHLPSQLALGSISGLGMNPDELSNNQRLNESVIHDLNENPVLPFEDESFDAVICTVSVEYLTQPVAVFKDVGRILKPGGCFCLTFSNRWFPPKVINIWQEIHEFERIGLVSEYFLLSQMYKDIHTLSVQGYPRPETDKYYGQLFVSDPVYGVWAYKR